MNYSKKSTSRKQKALKGKGTKMGKKLGVVFMKTLLVLIIALGVAGLCGGIGIIKGVMENAPDITSASVLPRGYKSVVYDADGNKTAELVAEGTNRTYVKLDNIPKHVQEAFIAIEDERFYDHNGIDIQGMVRAGVKFVVSGFRTTEGASRIMSLTSCRRTACWIRSRESCRSSIWRSSWKRSCLRRRFWRAI